jgi:hypothetical protein
MNAAERRIPVSAPVIKTTVVLMLLLLEIWLALRHSFRHQR